MNDNMCAGVYISKTRKSDTYPLAHVDTAIAWYQSLHGSGNALCRYVEPQRCTEIVRIVAAAAVLKEAQR